jgi:hypothetical protein
MGDARPSLSGTNVVFVRDLLLEKLGPEGVERLKAAMSPEARQSYFEATSVDWVPVDYVNQMNTRAAEVAGSTVMEFTTTMARLSVERTLHTIWRILLRFTSDEAIVTRTPVFFSRSFNRGKLATEIVGKGMARIRLTEWPDVPQLTLVGVMVGIETVLRVAGRKDVKVNLHRTAHGAEFLATWSVK